MASEAIWYLGLFIFIFLLTGLLRKVLPKYDLWGFTKDKFTIANIPPGGMAHGADEPYQLARMVADAKENPPATAEDIGYQLFRWLQPTAPHLPSTLAAADVIHREYLYLQTFVLEYSVHKKLPDTSISERILRKFWGYFRDAAPYTDDIQTRLDRYTAIAQQANSKPAVAEAIGQQFADECGQPADKRLKHMGSETYRRLSERVHQLLLLSADAISH